MATAFPEISIRHSALGWVKKSIDDNLVEINTDLKRYTEDADDELLERAKERLSVIKGVLMMIEQYGAAMLTEEMVALIEHVVESPPDKREAPLEVMLRAVLQLPDYLEHIQSGNRDIPIAILPLLNDIRAVRNQDLFSEKLLFLPDLSMHEMGADHDSISDEQNQASRLMIKKLRPVYQLALLNLIRDQDIEQSLAKLEKLCQTLEERSFSEQIARIWWIVSALIESVGRQQLELGVSIKNLLGKVDALFRVLMITGERGLLQRQPVEMIKNFLYYIAQPECDGPRAQAIKTAYRLEEFLPSESTRSRVLDNIAGPNQALLKTVAEAMKSDIETVKSALEVYVNGDLARTETLKDLPREMHIISDTLAMIGLGSQRQLVEAQIEVVKSLLEGERLADEEQLLSMAAELLQVEQALDHMQRRQPVSVAAERTDNDVSRDYELDNVLTAVVTAALDDIQKTKAAILEFIKDTSRHENIELCISLMKESRGALVLMGMRRAVAVIDGLIRYLRGFQVEEFVESSSLDSLSQVVVSLEYYLEALGEHRSDANSILDYADKQLRALLARGPESAPADGEATTSASDGNNLPLDEGASMESPLPTVDADSPPASAAEQVDDATTLADSPAEVTDATVSGAHKTTISQPAAAPEAKDDSSAATAATDTAGEAQEPADSGAAALADVVPMPGLAPAESPVAVDLQQVEPVDDQLEVLKSGADPEILEIYLEEAEEEAHNIARLQRDWLLHPEDENAIRNIRRAFHTIKGSGRLVGAMKIGEFAWDFEQLLNRTIDKAIEPSSQVIDVVGQAAQALPELVIELKSGATPELDINYLRGLARALAEFKADQLLIDHTRAAQVPESPDDHITDLDEPDSSPIGLGDETQILPAERLDLDQIPGDLLEEIEPDTMRVDPMVFDAGDYDETRQGKGPARENEDFTDTRTFSSANAGDAEYTRAVDYSSAADGESPSGSEAAAAIQVTRIGEDFLDDMLDDDALLLEEESQAAPPNDVDAAVNTTRPGERAAAADGGGDLLYGEVDDIASMAELNASDADHTDGGSAEAVEAEAHTDARIAALEARLGDFDSVDSLGTIVETHEAEEVELAPPPMELEEFDGYEELVAAAIDYQDDADDADELEALEDFSGFEDFTAPAEDEDAIEIDEDDATDLAEFADVDDAEISEADDSEEFPSLEDPDVATTFAAPVDFETAGSERAPAATGADQSESEFTAAVEQAAGGASSGEGPYDPFDGTKTIPPPRSGGGDYFAAESAPTELSFDPELLIIYQQEVEQHLGIVSSALDHAEQIGELTPGEKIYRALHTIHGASRTADISTIGELASLMEKPLKLAAAQSMGLDQEIVTLYRQGQLAIQNMTAELVEQRAIPAISADLKISFTALAEDLEEHTVEIPEDEAAEGDFIDTMTMMNEAVDQERDNELLTIFVDEANELLEMSDHSLHGWSRQQSDDAGREDYSAVMELQRYLHTLKGGARMAELNEISDLAHEMESMLIAVIDARVEKNEPLLELLADCFDMLHQQVDEAKADRPLGSSDGLVKLLRYMRVGADQDKGEEAVEKSLNVDSEEIDIVSENLPNEPQAGAERPSQDVIRVRSELLDNLISSAGEVSIYRARMEQQVVGIGSYLGELGQTITRLKSQLRSLEAETDAQIHYSHRSEASRSDFDPLEMDRYTMIQELSRSLSESVNDLSSLQLMLGEQVKDSETLLLQQSRLNTDLQDGLIKSRMVRFSGLLSRLRRLVRQSSQELAKKAELIVSGEENEIDNKVLDRMVAPLEHIIRNALSHGIETPMERVKKGKPETGSITIDILRDGSEIVIRVSDDGAGVNIDKVRSRAVQLGLIDERHQISDAELVQYILEPGFSTADHVTQLSGRGVGMDVVDIEIKQLGGTLQIETNPTGTTFIARLPFTLSINQAILVEAGDESYAIPLNNIEGITRLEHSTMLEHYRSQDPKVEYAGQEFSLHRLAKLVDAPPAFRSGGEISKAPIILCRAGDVRAALHVDEILGNREIVVKSLGKQLSQVKGLAGASILVDGSVVLILDIGGLIRQHASNQVRIQYQGELPDKTSRDKVMVVDDSITMRRVASKLLERHNYDVVTAKDGVDALAQLQDVKPDIMLLDIEMPRMDGFELASHMRNEESYSRIPIIMITSRTGEKHRDRAFEIGVSGYMGKPYQEDELISTIKKALAR